MENPKLVEFPPEVVEALNAGRKIEAIRRLREAKGLGLKEAKELLEQNMHHYKSEGNSNDFVSLRRNGSKHLLVFIIILFFIAYYYT